MKHFFSCSLMLILALAWLIPKANAQTYSSKRDWKVEFTAPGATYNQAAVSTNGTIVVAPSGSSTAELISGYTYTKLWRISGEEPVSFSVGTVAFPEIYGSGNYYLRGPGIASDADGNIWINSIKGASTGQEQPTKAIAYYTGISSSSNGSRTGVSLGSYAMTVRSDMMTAYGHPKSETGGYLWFAPHGQSYVNRITMVNASPKAKDQFSIPESTGTKGLVRQYTDNKLVFCPGGSNNTANIYMGFLVGNSISWTPLNVQSYCTGVDMFEIGGDDYVVYSKTATTVAIKNISTDTEVTVFNSPGTSKSEYVNNFINTKVTSDTTVEIYIYTPGAGASKHTLTVIPSEDPEPEPDPTDVEFTVNTTPVKTLDTSGLTGESATGKQMAVANDVTYVVYPGTIKNAFYYANMSNGKCESLPAGAKAGWGIATDDSRNLITAYDIGYTQKVEKVRVYKAASYGNPISISAYKDYDLTDLYKTNLTAAVTETTFGRTDFWHASGNCYDGDGALWFTDGATIVKIPIEAGVAKSEVTYTLPTGPKGTGWSSQSIFDQYATDEYIFQNGTGVWDCKINGSTIIATNLLSGSYRFAADIAYLQGHKIFARSNSTTLDGKIVIEDITTGTAMQLATITISPYPSSGIVNAWCEFEQIDDLTLGLYVYVPGGNTYKYLITATPVAIDLNPVENIEVTVVRDQDANEPTRQDAILTWAAPNSESEVESYDVYYRTRYTREGATEETINTWNYLGNTTELSITDVDIRYYQIGSETLERHYDYKVVPVYKLGVKGEESVIITATPEFIPFVPDWDEEKDQDDKKLGIDRYDGYCKVQLYWKFPQKNNTTNGGYISKWGCKPDYYSILRNGKQIATNISAFNYIDKTVMPGHDYVYNVVAHYYSMPDTAVSDDNKVHIDVRDWSKISYELSEVYNYSIATEGDSVVVPQGDFLYLTDRDSYRQGQFYNGYWYVAQLKNLPVNDEATAGGIYRIPTAASWENTDENPLKSESFKKIYTTKALQSAGIAIDEGGNIFIAQETTNDNTGLVSNYFANRLTKGRILMNTTGDGITYSDEQSYDVDLSGFNFAEYAVAGRNISLGRIDFFCMKGNLTGGTAQNPTKAYLYLAPNVSRAVYVIELTFDGTAVTASEHYKYDDYSISLFTGESFQDGGNNYAFPVMCEGRDNEFIHNLRSSAYSWHACHANLENNIHESGRQGTVYDTQSRVNNSGGCTIEWNGELFVITPQSQYSANSGNFYVGAASRSSNAVTAKNADLKLILPIDMWTQPDEDVNVNTNSSGVWLAAEKATDASGSIIDENKDGEADYIYIYMYVPGERFAKYKMTPSSLFPPSQVSLEIEKKYKKDYVELEHNPGGDIIRFDAKATWPEVTNYGTTAGGNPSYVILGYTVQLVDANGNVIDEYPSITFEMPRDIDGVGDDVNLGDGQGDGVVDNLETAVVLNDDGTVSNADGSLLVGLTWDKRDITHADGTVSNNVTCYDYTYKDVNKDVDYIAQVTVNYYGIDTETTGKVQHSPKTVWEDEATYAYDAPSGYVRVDEHLNNWGDWDNFYYGNPAKDEYDPADIYFNEYRISLAIDNPAFADMRKEPVTYYTISCNNSVERAADTPVNEFYLYAPNGLTDTAGNVLTADSDGYVKINNGQVPGEYNFSETNTGGKPHIYWDLRDYTKGIISDDVDYLTDKPSEWTYSVTANYAATNAKISEAASGIMEPDFGDKIPTDVEVIEATTLLNVYPIPATVTVTIKCGEAIDHVEIYSETGMLVKSLSGNSEQLLTIDVSDLTSGYYFLRVNNFALVKFIKR